MADDDEGTGGLFLEPPPGPAPQAEGIGFAPDLDDDKERTLPDLEPSARAARAKGERRPARPRGRYPLAEATLARLLGDDAAPEKGPVDDDTPFFVGASILRAPASIAKPREPRPTEKDAPAERARTEALMEDMVDLCLVGDEDGRHQVHLSFKDDVLRGLYVRLERRDDGLFACFFVADDTARRMLEGNVESMVARMRARGMRIAGYSIEVGRDS